MSASALSLARFESAPPAYELQRPAYGPDTWEPGLVRDRASGAFVRAFLTFELRLGFGWGPGTGQHAFGGQANIDDWYD